MSWLAQIRANARLRLGLTLIAAVLGLYGLLEWQDRQARLAQELQNQRGQVARLSSRQDMNQWPERLQEARRALKLAQRSLWRSGSLGLAQAEFQDWLRLQLRTANAQNAVVRIAENEAPGSAPADGSASAPGVGEITRVGAQVEFALTDPQMLVALLAAMASQERRVAVESLTVKAQRVDMRLAAFFIVDPSERARP